MFKKDKSIIVKKRKRKIKIVRKEVKNSSQPKRLEAKSSSRMNIFKIVLLK